MATSISQPLFRADSTILPIVSSDRGDLVIPWLQLLDWQYLPFTTPQTIIPLNRTAKRVDVTVKNCFFPTLVEDTGIVDTLDFIERTSGEGWNGANGDTALDAAFCSVQAKATSINLSTGISLQDGSASITHTYDAAGVIPHAILLGANGAGYIYEFGTVPTNNGFFKYEVGDTAMIEQSGGAPGGIVRYYLIKPDGRMILIRQTRTKLTENPKPEFLLYFTGSKLEKVAVFDADSESTFYEQAGVAYYRDDTRYLTWQKPENQRSSQSIGDTIEMADKRTQVTYSNSKRRLIGMSLTPKAFSLNHYWDFQGFVNWHDIDKEFIFVDYARKDLSGNPTEFWAKFTSAFIDTTKNGCIFEASQSILEDFRNTYIPRQDDTIPPLVTIDLIVAGSAILSGTASDNVLLTSLQLYKNNRAYGDIFLPDSAGNWTFTVPDGDLTDASNTFFVIATDYAGNQTQSNSMTFAVSLSGALRLGGRPLQLGGRPLVMGVS